MLEGDCVMDDLNEYNCPSCGANSNHKSIIIAFEVKIAELEKEHERVKKYNSSLLSKLKYYISEEEAEIRDLEQQAKGLKDFSITYNEMATNTDLLVNLLNYCANVLLGKAKALKEGK
jgi:hypothetical protein